MKYQFSLLLPLLVREALPFAYKFYEPASSEFSANLLEGQQPRISRSFLFRPHLAFLARPRAQFHTLFINPINALFSHSLVPSCIHLFLPRSPSRTPFGRGSPVPPPSLRRKGRELAGSQLTLQSTILTPPLAIRRSTQNLSETPPSPCPIFGYLPTLAQSTRPFHYSSTCRCISLVP